ncbi:hypothetical protein A3C98_03700 [Candidatus Roizmanbacteria bacterium RIFCSPHIGHO2_02_FULL_37_15]|uniref:Uncharacterized protein n=1 Tax=Candidatus Roizmanbacteria bacterium RIFCSPLOWO2_01_FULL_37_16 TaxID=1802058 RepID=A0A1F7IKL4_9BACT|nr:MAG: hypothetical protein A2859_05030 [Candidatus Roizmanbacteria bacterium RIFCSPHIGHO2_01_FULL_37_16b]OGK20472.1 MAG: hypothetical protein A3C98_03700 [Candidatus Roizmanbacteria bacterium RIFCSPHIGHO2_02_FULL_37_15]OGK31739.1 MAG: hypothetical protein A3F57_00110 [Candidatus Roizmanbacteria bacterium RIFCSPHIGHO2_12_FULL_36_11]OGK43899.1 MAG: hypothetical protein A3B40_03745 [Candidatus Roizmanbacteria bacterium RIFCSPLOWO2_01_FULL_37_16]OGK55825.1 MAG: hypothetical protein A3I50_03345 [C
MKIDKSIKESLKKYLAELLKKEKEKITLISAYPLDNTELSPLYEYIPDLKESQISFVIDKKILAGVVIKIGSKVIDLSLSDRLNQLRNKIYEIDR